MPRRRTKSEKSEKDRNGRVDEAGEETFPASDPPSYAGGGTRIGSPLEPEPSARKRKPARKPARRTKSTSRK